MKLRRLEWQLADNTPLLGRWRRRRAAKRLAKLARKGWYEAITALARELATGADESVRNIARAALRSLPDGPARENLYHVAFEKGGDTLAIVVEAGYLPSDPTRRATLLALGGRWEELDAFDLDGMHLRAAYEVASPDVRRGIAASARVAGRAQWARIAVGGREHRRVAQMTRDEWQDVVTTFVHLGRPAETWRLVQDAPPLWARELLLAVEHPEDLPEGDREDFARLSSLAARCEREGPGLSRHWRVVRSFSGHTKGEVGGVRSLAATPDGSLLASGGYGRWEGGWVLNPYTANKIHLWRLPDGEWVGQRGEHLFGVTCLAVTADGSLLVSGGGGDKPICLWRLPQGNFLKSLRGHRGGVACLAVSPDGSLLASGSGGETVRLWHLPDGKRVATLRGQKNFPKCLAFTADGGMLAVGYYSEETIRLWRLSDRECVATLRGHTNRVTCLAVTPDGSLLASGSDDGTVRLWSLPDGECVATLRGHERGIRSLAVTPDGSMLASGCGGDEEALEGENIRLWRLPGGEPMSTLLSSQGVSCLIFTTLDGTLLASAEGTRIRLWRPELAVLAATPVARLEHGYDYRLPPLQGNRDLTERERAWLEFMLALVEWRRRFDLKDPQGTL